MSNEEQAIIPSMLNEKYYNPQIEEDAQRYGYKAANLINLQQLIEEFARSPEGQKLEHLYGQMTVKVPDFMPVDNSIIENHLDVHAPEWRGLFNQFQESFEQQEDKKIIRVLSLF